MKKVPEEKHDLSFYSEEGCGPFLVSDIHPHYNTQLRWICSPDLEFLKHLVPWLPSHIIEVLKILLSTPHAFSRLHHISDLTYLVLQEIGVILLAHMREKNIVTDRIESLLARIQEKPTHGIWYEFSRLCALEGELQNETGVIRSISHSLGVMPRGHKPLLVSVHFPYFDKFGNEHTRRVRDTPLSILVTFRNKYLGHGVSFDDQQSLELWRLYRPVVIALLQQLMFFRGIKEGKSARRIEDTVGEDHSLTIRKPQGFGTLGEHRYQCITATCEASLERWGFLSFQKCPICGEALKISVTSKNVDLEAACCLQIPYMIAYPLSQLKTEHDPYRQLHLAKDAFSNFLKHIGLLVFSEYIASSLKLQKFTRLYESYLSRPQLGHWNAFIREAIEVLEEAEHSWLIPELPRAYYEINARADEEGHSLIDRLILMRNQVLGHGFVPSLSASQMSLTRLMSDFLELLKYFEFCQKYELRSGPLNRTSNQELSLMGASPAIVNKRDEGPTHPYIQLESGRRYLELAPFFISPQLYFPKSISSKSTLMLYEQNTGKRVIYFGPESVIGETDGSAFDALSLILRKKQSMPALDLSSIDEADAAELVAVHNSIQIDSLVSAGNILVNKKGLHIYERRPEIEAKIVSWSGSEYPLGLVLATPGAGKTNLFVSMIDLLSDHGHMVVLVRAKNCLDNSVGNHIANQLNLGSEEGLISFVNNFQRGKIFQRFIVLIDGLNEHFDPLSLFKDASRLASKIKSKFLISCRDSTYWRQIIAEIHFNAAELMLFELELLNLKDLERLWDRYTRPTQESEHPVFKINTSLKELYYNQPVIYQSLKNPLHLRLFLDTYSGKSLPRKDKKILSIWSEYDAGLSVL